MYLIGREDLEYILRAIRVIKMQMDMIYNIVEPITSRQGDRESLHNPDEYLEREYIDS